MSRVPSDYVIAAYGTDASETARMAFFMGEIRFHYSGRFVGDGESLEYVDGIVNNLTVDPDKLSHIKLLGILDDAGEVLVMCDDLSIHGSVDIYVEHGVDVPEDAPLLIDGVEDVLENGAMGDQNAEQPAGDDHVGEQGLGDNGDANLNGQADIGDGQLGGDGGNGQGENNNIDDRQNVEVPVEDIDEVAINATFDDFETILEEMVQQGMNKVSGVSVEVETFGTGFREENVGNDDEGSVEGASDDEVEEGYWDLLSSSYYSSEDLGDYPSDEEEMVDDATRTKSKFPVFNPDNPHPHIETEMVFKNVDQFKQAVSLLSITEKKAILWVKN
ncbi:hypothetical protein CCACVL1_22999 [Corchorus capsularis]|uniref:Uncharacterized protein n=1 Tax=Corchorus capsularis TaxID=210143 RepID=A0A1R3GVP6_COCAP|nr:hypothetical protein CCACVL1_22999 [Corchorus capsularis]